MSLLTLHFLAGHQRRAAVGAKTAYIKQGSPCENGFIEPFNARLCDKVLDCEIFYSLAEAKIVIKSWHRHYNTVRPHASLGYKPPAPRSSSQRWPRGRLRKPDQLRRRR